MIKILDSSLVRLGVIRHAITSSRLEEINGENVLDFTAVLDEKLSSLITQDSVFELDDDYFDTAVFKTIANEDNTYTVEVEADHVSYRLNDADYNVEYFTETGTPTYILGKILEGTPFTVGSVEFTDATTYSAQEAKSRRQLLMEFVAYLGGELSVNKFEVSIVTHLGSTTAQPVIKDRNVKIVYKNVNKRTLDDEGNPTVSYGCTPIYLPGDSYSLGDEIILIQKKLGIQESLRVVSINHDIYDPLNVTFEFSNYINGLASSLYEIATSAVSKDALYNGIRIGPEYGFEAVRNDKKARAYFRSDAMKFQSGDGSGTTWKDRLYYEYDSDLDETTLVYDGKFTAAVITVLQALITPNLYAEKATIAELTVDSLDTNPKVQNYLRGDTSTINYCQIVGQIIQFISGTIISTYGATRTSSGTWDMASNPQTADYYSSLSVDDSSGAYSLYNGVTSDAYSAYQAGRVYRAIDASSYYKITGVDNLGFVYYDVYTIGAVSVNYEQLKNRKGQLMYWTDDTHVAATTDETAYPVYVYLYNELIKLELTFEYDGVNYIPKITLGAGTGTGDNGKAKIYKDTTGFYIDYFSTVDGTKYTIKITDDGIDFSGFPTISYAENVIIEGICQVWVQTDTPTAAKANDLWVDTDDYSRYDVEALLGAQTLATSDDEVITASGTFTITLHSASVAGIIKKIYNIGTGIITIAGTINGISNMYLFPGESVSLVTDGSGWRH
jgi:hypothetical protein